MLDRLRRSARVVGALVRVSLMTGMQYRADFLIEGVTSLFRPAAAVAPLLLVFNHREAVVGWSMADATVVLGLFLLMQAIVEGVIEPNLGAVVEAVRTGSFDLVLLRPADSQLLVSLQRVDPGKVWQLLAGLFVVGWGLAARPPPGLADVAVAVALLLCGVVAIYGLWLFAICLAFRWVRVDNLRHLLSSIADAGRWPVTVFGDVARAFLTVVVPVALFTTFPALALRGEWTAGLIATGVAIAAVFGVGSRVAWLRSLAHYTSASS